MRLYKYFNLPSNNRDKDSEKEVEKIVNKEEEDKEDGLNAKEKAKKTIEGLKGDGSISQEEEMSITGSNARFMIMQKLAMKDKEVIITTVTYVQLQQCPTRCKVSTISVECRVVWPCASFVRSTPVSNLRNCCTFLIIIRNCLKRAFRTFNRKFRTTFATLLQKKCGSHIYFQCFKCSLLHVQFFL